MRKTIDEPTHIKNRILACIYIFRSLPSTFIKQITRINGIEQESVRKVILYLERSTLIQTKKADVGTIYLQLTSNGQTYVKETIMPLESKKPLFVFRRDRSTNYPNNDHTYYNFVYIWELLRKNPEKIAKSLHIYEDSNRNNCKLPFSYLSRRTTIYPDALILYINEDNNSFTDAQLVESDTGGETSTIIYKKLVSYGVFAYQGLDQLGYSNASLHFIFKSHERVKNLFEGDLVIEKFRERNIGEKIRNVPIEILIKGYQRMPIFYTDFHRTHDNKNNTTFDSPLLFKKLDIVGKLLRKETEWTEHMRS